MDDLTYSYDSGNKLLKVSDAIVTPTNVKGEFKDDYNYTSPDPSNDYTYDLNGNLTKDLNKGIEGASGADGIVYNHLNLPTEVRFGSTNKIKYIYDATGVKLEKKVIESSSSDVYTYYAGNYVYENSSLKFFNHPEGYVEPKDETNLALGYNYVYQYKDHLGNIRLSYSDADGNGSINASTEILEENNYYPFGLKHRGYNNVVSANANSIAKKFKFQGQELEESLGLDMYEFELRQYDPALGRFMTTDPYEQFMSPYVAMGNNPIVAFDPDGGLCIDSNGNYIACPDEDIFDDYRDNKDNHIDILDEVVVTGKSKETKANEDYWAGINKDAEILDKLATLETGKTSEQRAEEEESINIETMPIALVNTEPTQLVFWPIEIMGGTSWMKGVNIFRWGSKIKASNVKQLKALIKKLSKPGSELNAKELKKLEKLVEKFGGRIRRDLNPVKGKIKKPHVQVEGLGKSVESRHIWLKNGVK